jgi:hypothetical protein
VQRPRPAEEGANLINVEQLIVRWRRSGFLYRNAGGFLGNMDARTLSAVFRCAVFWSIGLWVRLLLRQTRRCIVGAKGLEARRRLVQKYVGWFKNHSLRLRKFRRLSSYRSRATLPAPSRKAKCWLKHFPPLPTELQKTRCQRFKSASRHVAVNVAVMTADRLDGQKPSALRSLHFVGPGDNRALPRSPPSGGRASAPNAHSTIENAAQPDARAFSFLPPKRG